MRMVYPQLEGQELQDTAGGPGTALVPGQKDGSGGVFAKLTHAVPGKKIFSSKSPNDLVINYLNTVMQRDINPGQNSFSNNLVMWIRSRYNADPDPGSELPNWAPRGHPKSGSARIRIQTH